MGRKRIVAIAPGRGSYTRDTLGCIKRRSWSSKALAILAQADEYRTSLNLPTISDLDNAEKFSARLHQMGENSSALTFTLSCMDFVELEQSGHEIVAVTGNSLGWYTTLVTSGALSFLDGLKIVEQMAQRQKGSIVGGQIIVPEIDEQWCPDARLSTRIQQQLRQTNDVGADHMLTTSIELGGMRVLAGTTLGVKHFLDAFEPVKQGRLSYPFQLAFHSAFHTSLMAEASDAALERFGEGQELNWRNLSISAIDGRAYPWGTAAVDPIEELIDYTLKTQVIEPYNFGAAVRHALLEFQPDQVVLLGPGDTLGSSIAHTMIRCHWQGLQSKSDFVASQKLPTRPIVAFGRDDQRSALLQEAVR